MDVEVRPRRDSDLSGCIEALYASHLERDYPLVWPSDPASWLSPPGLLEQWVAAARDRVAGHLILQDGPNAAVSVSRLFVAPASQRQGIGRTLLHLAQRRAQSLQRALELDVLEDSADAVHLYEREGWQLIERAPAPFSWPDGRTPIQRRYLAPRTN